jgi:hypothetical protein
MHAGLAPSSLFPGCEPKLHVLLFFFFFHLVRINSFFPFSFAERRGERISPTVEEGKFFFFSSEKPSFVPLEWFWRARHKLLVWYMTACPRILDQPRTTRLFPFAACAVYEQNGGMHDLHMSCC